MLRSIAHVCCIGPDIQAENHIIQASNARSMHLVDLTAKPEFQSWLIMWFQIDIFQRKK